MGPEALAQVLRPLAGLFDPADHPDLLLGLATPDDAAVYRLDSERAMVLTSDFFPPVVDDPFQFGAIAAANALSDLYAMGATPTFAINLVAFPDNLDTAILSEILRGGGEKVREAGAVVAGGHTTSDAEPKYGLAVVGLVHPDRMWTKAGARAGDELLLTKALGTGTITTANKNGVADAAHLRQAVESMQRLHRVACEVLRGYDGVVHAATDVTGFSLAGHGHEMAQHSGCALELHWDRLPWLPGAEDYARDGQIPGGTRRNREYYGRWVEPQRSALADWEAGLFFDPQTSGGLLLSVAAARADEIERALSQAGECVYRIGRVTAGPAGKLTIV